MLSNLRKIAKAQGGMAAAEFALILPVMLVLVFGSIEVTNALICRTDVSTMAGTAADLVAQETQVGQTDINNVFSALSALVYPYPTTGAQIVITSVIDDGHGGGKVDWSQAYNATPRSKGTPVTVPTGLITTGGSVIMSEITYTYTPVSTWLVKYPITMSNRFYSHPRRVAQVLWTG
jgi:Flp pilus assembly protein TadG